MEEYCLPWGPAGIAMWRQAEERKKREGGEDGTRVGEGRGGGRKGGGTGEGRRERGEEKLTIK